MGAIVRFMDGQDANVPAGRSLSAYVEGIARFLRKEAEESLRLRNPAVIKEKTGMAHKVEQVAQLLRKNTRRKKLRKHKS